jgi:predicted DNA-binding transcriptional regulator
MKKANAQVIKNAFARLKLTKDAIIRQGMYGLLEDAVQIALFAHDEKHQSHIELGDTYGWMLVHNHRIEEIAVVSTSDNRGKATKMLRATLKDLPNKGWVGVVMAGMQPANFFTVLYEVGILDGTIQITKQNFSQYFKKL